MKKIKVLIPFIITTIILFILFSKFDIENIKNILITSNKKVLFLATIWLFLSAASISALRWKLILKLLNYDISFFRSFEIFMASLPVAKISPANTGDVIKKHIINTAKRLLIISNCILRMVSLPIKVLILFLHTSDSG